MLDVCGPNNSENVVAVAYSRTLVLRMRPAAPSDGTNPSASFVNVAQGELLEVIFWADKNPIIPGP